MRSSSLNYYLLKHKQRILHQVSHTYVHIYIKNAFNTYLYIARQIAYDL